MGTISSDLDKKERKAFDEMWDLAKLYLSSCSNSVQLVSLHPIVISILFNHYKELKECVRQVEEIRGDKKVNNSDNYDNHYSSICSNVDIIVMMTEQEKPLETYDEMVREIGQEIIVQDDIEIMEEEMPGTLDGYFRMAADNKIL